MKKFGTAAAIITLPCVLVFILLSPLVGRNHAAHASSLRTVRVMTVKSCRLPGLPAWTRSATALQVSQENPYLNEPAVTYAENGIRAVTVWDQANWVVAVSNPSTFSYAPTEAEAALARVRLPGRGRALWLLSTTGWSLEMEWCTQGRAYRISIPRAADPESAPVLAAVLTAWKRDPVNQFVCHTHGGAAVVCLPVQ